MSERQHSPHTGKGREKRRSSGKAPGGIAPSWPTKGRMPSNSLGLRRKAKRRHPDCATDSKPHRKVVADWLRRGLTLEQAEDFVRTKPDTLHSRALDVYRKMAEHSPDVVQVEGRGKAFPVTARDFAAQAASSILEHINDER